MSGENGRRDGQGTRPYFEGGGQTLYLGDCRDVLPTLGPVDHAIFDAPYSPHVHNNIVTSKRNRHDKEPLSFAPLDDDTREFVAQWMAANVRRWVIAFTDAESAHLWKEAMERAGLEYVRTGVWIRGRSMPQKSGDRPAVAHEEIVIAHAAGVRKRWNGGGKKALWEAEDDRERYHATQKPVDLIKKLILDFTDVGETIVDPFCGSGTLLIAARLTGRRGIGVEIDEQNCAIAERRIGETREQGTLTLSELGSGSRPRQERFTLDPSAVKGGDEPSVSPTVDEDDVAPPFDFEREDYAPPLP